MDRRDAKAIDAYLASARADERGSSECHLPRLMDCAELSCELRTAIRTAVDTGFTLRNTISCIDSELLREWLGTRWYLLHRHQLDMAHQWSGIIASRLNRTDTDFAQWPRWIECAVRSLARDGQTLLIVPGTASSAIVEPLARQTSLNRLTVRWPPVSRKISTIHCSVGKWLLQTLEEITNHQSVAYATLFLSSPDGSASPSMSELPLQDRLVVALSHHLMALSVRPGGNIAQLLNRRLQDDRFPLGTVSLRIPSTDMRSDHNWLDRHAIGWYLPTRTFVPDTPRLRFNSRPPCQSCEANNPMLRSWTADARLLLARDQYLIHCVRGSDNDGFRAGECAAVVDAIVQGNLSPYTPYETLVKIAIERRVRASAKLLRTSAAAVSFTAVDLPELMARRRYQSHLGRWDWEPYGVMIRRDVLAQLGARPVIYGDDDLFEQLSADDRPYFQPAHRRSARMEQEHWQAEEEWRLLDDVRLAQLPADSVLLFVQFQTEAQSLATFCPWPVIWLQADQTQRSPIVGARRRHSSARTSRN